MEVSGHQWLSMDILDIGCQWKSVDASECQWLSITQSATVCSLKTNCHLRVSLAGTVTTLRNQLSSGSLFTSKCEKTTTHFHLRIFLAGNDITLITILSSGSFFGWNSEYSEDKTVLRNTKKTVLVFPFPSQYVGKQYHFSRYRYCLRALLYEVYFWLKR